MIPVQQTVSHYSSENDESRNVHYGKCFLPFNTSSFSWLTWDSLLVGVGRGIGSRNSHRWAGAAGVAATIEFDSSVPSRRRCRAVFSRVPRCAIEKVKLQRTVTSYRSVKVCFLAEAFDADDDGWTDGVTFPITNRGA